MFREMKGLPDPDEEKSKDETPATDENDPSEISDGQVMVSDSAEVVSEEAFAELSEDISIDEVKNNNTDIFAE